jgi:hypothetical protein
VRWPTGELLAIYILPFLFILAVLIVREARRQPRYWRYCAICAIAGLASVEMLCTNTELKSNDLAPAAAAIALLCLRPWDEGSAISRGRKTLLAGLLSLLFVFSGHFALTHVRIEAIGPGKYYEALPTETIRDGYFRGVEAGPRLRRVLSQTQAVLSSHPARRIFFGPRMEFGYAAFQIAPLRRMPLLWDPGNMYSPNRILQFLRGFQEQDPELLIFLKGDYTRMGPLGFYLQHTATYSRIDEYSELTVFCRRKEVPVTYVNLPAK